MSASPIRWVLLPGLDGTGALFDPLCRALHPMIAEPAVVVRYSSSQVTTAAEDVACIEDALRVSGCDSVGGGGYVLVAESFSGSLAVRLASTRPVGLRALVLSTSFVRNPLPAALRCLGDLAGLSRWAPGLPRWAVRRMLLDTSAPAALVDRVVSSIGEVAPRVVASRLRRVMKEDVRERLREVSVPVAYLVADRDRLVGRRGLAQVESVVPDVTVCEMSGPHLLLQSQPDEAIRHIQRFVGSVD